MLPRSGCSRANRPVDTEAGSPYLRQALSPSLACGRRGCPLPRSVPVKALEPESALHKSRRPRLWSNRLPPSKVPFLLRSCSKQVSCSSRDCEVPRGANARLWERSRTVAQARYGAPSHRQDQPLGLKHLGHGHFPGGSQPLISFAGGSDPFFLVEPIRFMLRHTTERLTSSPAMTRRYSQRSRRVTNGRSLSSSSSNLRAGSSMMGRLPGALPGESALPWRNFLR